MIGRKLDSIDRKAISIDLASIKPGRFKPKFLSHFRSVKQQVRLIENLENSDFWKTEHFNAKPPQSTLFYEWNAWVWDEKFFKNPWIQPRSPKNKIFNQIVLKTQTLNTFCIKVRAHLILDGHNKNHTQYYVLSLAKNNLCSVCN